MKLATRLRLQIPNAGTIKYSYAADGTLLTEIDAWGKQTVVVNTIGYNRGYTGHEMMPEFGLINMNGRVYDPNLGRFLSPDNYVQMPDNSQNFNRYSYCLNNPLKYNDPSGEFVNLLIGAAVGGVLNWCTNGCKFNATGLAYFGVGALAGALGTGIGAGVNSCLPVAGSASGGFSAGFWGTQTATKATTSFVSGAAIGGAVSFSGGFICGFGNSLVSGDNWKTALRKGALDGLIGGVSGAFCGGIVSGLDAVAHGRRFWDGAIVQKIDLVNQNNPIVAQRGLRNCVGASGESASNCQVSQEQIRAMEDAQKSIKEGRYIVSNPDETGLYERNAFQNVAKELGLQYEPGTIDNVMGYMAMGDKVGISYEVDVATKERHMVLMNKVTLKTTISVKGKISSKLIYQVMNPAGGGKYCTINFNGIKDAAVYRLVTPYSGPLF